MNLRDFEAMVARARYRFEKSCEVDDATERRIYVSDGRGPRMNVLCRIAGDGWEVDDLHALSVEAILDEEGYFED